MWDNLSIGGFHFSSAAEYADAKHELDTINLIASKMDLNNPEIALKAYYKLLEKNTFHTVIGLSFLSKLRSEIREAELISEEELKTIPAPILTEVEAPNQVGDENDLENENKINDEDDGESESEEDKDSYTKLKRDAGLYRDMEKKARSIADYNRDMVKKLKIVIAGLCVVIVVLFVMALYNKNVTFTNEEIAFQDKYSAWQEELEERERAVQLKEEELNLREDFTNR